MTALPSGRRLKPVVKTSYRAVMESTRTGCLAGADRVLAVLAFGDVGHRQGHEIGEPGPRWSPVVSIRDSSQFLVPNSAQGTPIWADYQESRVKSAPSTSIQMETLQLAVRSEPAGQVPLNFLMKLRTTMTLDERVALLEKNSRLWRTAAITLGLALFAVAFTSCSSEPAKSPATTEIPGVIQARKFQVLGEHRQLLVELTATESGKGMVVTRDGKGQELVKLTASVNGDGIVNTYNGEGQELVKLTVTEGGGGAVVTSNGKGQELVKLGATVGGGGVVVTSNGKGQELVELTASVNGEGMVNTYNGKGQELVSLGMTKEGEGLVNTYNGKGQKLVVLGTTKGGEGAVGVYDRNGDITKQLP